MTTDEALAIIRAAGVADRFILAGHARERMRQRGVSRGDVREAMSSCRGCVAQLDARWRVDGPDLDGDDLTVIVAIEGAVVVITVY